MRKLTSLLLIAPLFISTVIAAEVPALAGHIAVANRQAGTVSIIDVSQDQVIRTLELTGGELTAEPMYVVYKDNRLYVGDRANHRVVVFDSFGFNQLASISTGRGVFHMWAAANSQKLLVNNDIDNTFTIIDTNQLVPTMTVSIPDDLVDAGFKPHDIVVSDDGEQWYVSLVDGVPGNDYVLQYQNNNNYPSLTGRLEVGGDPHLFLSPVRRHELWVASQDASSLTRVNLSHFRAIRTKSIANAHGIYGVGSRLYVTNIADGGSSALNTLDARRFRLIDSDDTPQPVPHNISVTDDGQKIYITHSGSTQNTVSVFTTHTQRGLPEYLTEISVGANPFGLAFIPH
ncbi:YncE family protein [Shewanella sp. NIFS-20-20]|uniref:YncE family protein n=1 Tax=Shewanella sp. NIFS-20-20 TaxID=2853806 RepID=UPI001C45808D|nr:hypothetical protein [Shewanella sp. NIFS-20-20]MBV7315681.1 hypothetical protein [Shewanella sp. NIFS-20-20]